MPDWTLVSNSVLRSRHFKTWIPLLEWLGLKLDNATSLSYCAHMAETALPQLLPGTLQQEADEAKSELDPGYLVVCWNDPVNFMDYVTHVFKKVFGWTHKKAEFHMLQVHEQGKSVLTRESLEKAEHYVHQLQKHSLHATMERDD